MDKLNYPKPAFQSEEIGYQPLNNTEDYIAKDSKDLIVSPSELGVKLDEVNANIDAVQGNVDVVDKKVDDAVIYLNQKVSEAVNDAKSYTDKAVANLVDSAPETLDTLNEVANALKANEDVVASLNAAIGTKANKVDVEASFAEVNESLENKETELKSLIQENANNIELKADADLVYSIDVLDEKFDEVSTEMALKVTKEELNAEIDIINDKLDNVYNKDTIDTKVSELEDEIANKANKDDVANTVSALEESINTKANADDVYTKFDSDEKYLTSQALDDYYDRLECDGKYLTSAVLSDFYNKAESDAKYITEHQSLDSYYTKSECDGKYLTNAVLNDFYNKAESDAKYYTKSDIDDKGYLTQHQSLDEYYTKSQSDNLFQEKLDSSIESVQMLTLAQIEALTSRVVLLEEKVASLKKVEVEVLNVKDDVNAYSGVNKDYIFANDVTTKELNIEGKSVTVQDVTLSNGGKLILKGDVEMKDVTIKGTYNRTGANKNTILAVNNSDEVVLRNVTVDPITSYNGIEIGLQSGQEGLPKTVLIDNCDFVGTFNNNVINVFGTKNNAVININNCKFGTFSNALRLSNKSNVNCTINFTNCEFADLDSACNGGNCQYRGIVICQDYTSTSTELAEENNLFGDGKITINVINCKNNGELIATPSDIATVCGSKDGKQLLYVYRDKGGFIDYETYMYPTLNIL